MLSFTVALVIVAQTLLASSNYALKYNYKINNNREVLAYAAGNFAGALVGCCPINGSVSRTGIGDQFGARSQVMSLSAAFTMVLVLLFGTGLLQYLPVPVLTGIVICALIGILEFGLAKKLWKTNKQEFLIFMAAIFWCSDFWNDLRCYYWRDFIVYCSNYPRSSATERISWHDSGTGGLLCIEKKPQCPPGTAYGNLPFFGQSVFCQY